MTKSPAGQVNRNSVNSLPLVSVGIPTYNRPEGLRNTIDHICNQTYKNLEIIVSDNNSDNEEAASHIVNNYGCANRQIRFYRQMNNIGAIRNFKFLLDQALGDYFVWAADDDLLDPCYIEKCMEALFKQPGAVVGITGFDVEDKMLEPTIRKEYTHYLLELPSQNTFKRMQNYILQPEYCGKYRVLWGVIDRKILTEAFEEVLGFLEPEEKPMWSYMPIDFAILARGDLAVFPECLFHAFLLPSSDGKKEDKNKVFGQLRLARKGFRNFGRVVQNTDSLSSFEKYFLNVCLLWEEIYAISRLIPYQIIQMISPNLARKIKKLWFTVLMRK